VLLQLFDEGVLTDGLGRKVDFKNTIIIMTSNAGTREIQDHTSFGFTDIETDFDYSSMKDQILDQVKLIFNPEFLNRIDDTIVFHPLSRQVALEIVDLLLVDLRENLFTLNIELFLTKRAKMLLLGKGFSPKYGARNLRREIQSSLEKPISELLLENVFVSGNKVKVDTSDGQFTFNSVRKKRMSSKS
jgi:ATP-dependent Clp protease ATP-binding subunit ClpC